MDGFMAQVIGFDTTPLQFSQPSGVGHYARQLLTALIARDDGRRYAPLANRVLNGQVPVGALPQIGRRFPNRSIWMQTMLPRAVRDNRLDICHFTNSLAPINLPCPMVITFHDMSLFRHPGLHPLRAVLVVRPLLPVLARRADAIITVSMAARRDVMSDLHIRADKVHVVYEAAAGHFQPIGDGGELERVRARYDLSAPFVLYVGTLEPRKNLTRLVRAFAGVRRRLPDAQLILVGQLGWKYEALLAEIERLDLKMGVRRLGYVPEGDLAALYSLATAFVFPSIYEGFGLPIVEAMACGTPVLTSDRSSMAEIARGAARLIDPFDTAAMTEGLFDLLTDETLRLELRAAGLKRAAEFSWARAAEETAAVYDKVCGRRG
jgi:glycosyltransferase involved in cell wall biosynthesis